jgi:hypothetical protein
MAARPVTIMNRSHAMKWQPRQSYLQKMHWRSKGQFWDGTLTSGDLPLLSQKINTSFEQNPSTVCYSLGKQPKRAQGTDWQTGSSWHDYPLCTPLLEPPTRPTSLLKESERGPLTKQMQEGSGINVTFSGNWGERS